MIFNRTSGGRFRPGYRLSERSLRPQTSSTIGVNRIDRQPVNGTGRPRGACGVAERFRKEARVGKTVALNEPTDVFNPPAPAFSEDWLISLRRGMGTQNGSPILMTGFRISESQSKVIRHRRLTLSRGLTAVPDERPLIAAELARLVSAFPSQETGLAVAGALNADAYLEALGDMPAWAVRRARENVMSGRTPYGRPFGPTAVEFADLVRAVMEPYRRDFADLVALAAVVDHEPTMEEKASVSKGFDDLRGELRPDMSEVSRRAQYAADWAALESRAAANGRDPKSTMDGIKDGKLPPNWKRAGA